MKNSKLSSLNYKEKKESETDYDTITIGYENRGRGKIRSKNNHTRESTSSRSPSSRSFCSRAVILLIHTYPNPRPLLSLRPYFRFPLPCATGLTQAPAKTR